MSKTTPTLPTLRELLAAGAHYGHRKERSKPAARKFTHVIRDGVCIINLEATRDHLERAAKILKGLVDDNKTVLFVGTKRQAAATVARVATDLGMPSVTRRWLGGTLTNFEVIRKNVAQLTDLDRRLTDETQRAKYTKRELLKDDERAKKLHQVFDGIMELTKLPDLLFVIDPHEEKTAVAEAQSLAIPIMALCDTDTNPDQITYPIPGNDDAPKTVDLVLTYLAGAMKSTAVN
ncbi:30S ribosomal protein S2 [Candidatus Berkelbacteria bacterium]|nr:30S ribosomal protein S2 [Candidatus Berkelbacteria bacterium]